MTKSAKVKINEYYLAVVEKVYFLEYSCPTMTWNLLNDFHSILDTSKNVDTSFYGGISSFSKYFVC